MSHTTNIGVAGVMLTAFKILHRLDFDYVVQCDADGQHPIKGIPKLIEQAIGSHSDLVIGSRYLDQRSLSRHRSSTVPRRIGGVALGAVLRLFSAHTRITDPTSGFRAYSASAARCLIRQMPDEYPEPESIALLLTAGRAVREVEVEMSARLGGQSSLAGLKGLQFMLKVMTALLGLRLRALLGNSVE